MLLKRAVRIFCVVPIATGTLDLVLGAAVLRRAGADIPDSLTTDPVVNNQIGFWGAIWFGFGVLLWQTSADLRMNAKTFQTLGGIVVASGAARAMMMVRYGSPGAIMTGAMALELVVMPALLAAHRVSLKRAP